jgi:hypothetical protein
MTRGGGVVTFRPTPVQALARGLYVGGVLGLAVGTVAAAVGLSSPLAVPAWVLGVTPLLVITAVGAIAGVAYGRQDGTDADDWGIHSGSAVGWQEIEDLRTERSGGRITVAMLLDSGAIARLRAPYDGRFLAGDREFERKLFMLRNLWETHRSFALTNGYARRRG